MATPENQAKIEWLKRYTRLDQEINRKCEELSRWKSRATKVTSSMSLAPGGAKEGNQIPDTVEKIISLESEIDADIDELLLARGEIEKAIKSVPNGTLRLLLEHRYIDGMTWEQVAVEMNYNYRWVLRLHGKAIAQLAIESHPSSVL